MTFYCQWQLLFGMSTREFWEEDPNLLWAYRKSYMDKIKLQQETDNFNAWLNGLYVFDAVSKSIYNNFGRKEAQPALNYIEKPYDFSKTKEDYEKEKIKERENSIKEQLKRGKRVLSKGVGEQG